MTTNVSKTPDKIIGESSGTTVASNGIEAIGESIPALRIGSM
jgi:hypothetical protein